MRILLVIYDNESFIHWFPQGLAYIAAVLKKGNDIVIYNQDLHHYPDEHLTEYLNKNKFDVVGLSLVGGYYQYRKLLKLSEAINKSKNRPFFMIGGHCVSAEPEYFLNKTKANVLIIGEGEETVVELVNVLKDKQPLTNITGLAYKENDKVVITPKRKLIKDIDSIPFPAYELFPIEYYRLVREPRTENTDFVMPVLSGRGCIYACNFCWRMIKGFRPRSNENIFEEVKLLKKDYGINYIAFSDELLMSSEERVISFCEYIIKNNINIKWNCSGRLNYASKQVIRLMKKAGCVFINYGIECYDDNMLKVMNKHLTTEQIRIGIENTLAEGISPGFNIIFGNIGEGKEELQKGVDFLLKYDDGAQMRTIRPVTPYPGSPIYHYAIKNGMLKDCEDFYENKHTNSDLLSVNLSRLSDEDFYKALYDANKTLLDNYTKNQMKKNIEVLDSLYKNKNSKFRGFRQI